MTDCGIIDKFKTKNYGNGFITKYLFTNLDDWDKFKNEIGFFSEEKYPLGIHRDTWIEPDRIPFIMLYTYDGEGWHNMEFVYPDDFPKLYFPAEDVRKRAT